MEMLKDLEVALENSGSHMWASCLRDFLFRYHGDDAYPLGLLLQAKKPRIDDIDDIDASWSTKHLPDLQVFDGAFPLCAPGDTGDDTFLQRTWLKKLAGTLFKSDAVCLLASELEDEATYIVRWHLLC